MIVGTTRMRPHAVDRPTASGYHGAFMHQETAMTWWFTYQLPMPLSTRQPTSQPTSQQVVCATMQLVVGTPATAPGSPMWLCKEGIVVPLAAVSSRAAHTHVHRPKMLLHALPRKTQQGEQCAIHRWAADNYWLIYKPCWCGRQCILCCQLHDLCSLQTWQHASST